METKIIQNSQNTEQYNNNNNNNNFCGFLHSRCKMTVKNYSNLNSMVLA